MRTRVHTRRRTVLAWSAALLATPLIARLGDAAAPRVIPVRARRFVFTPDKIVLKAGEPVVLELIAEDVIMGFSAPDLGVRADMPPGQTVRLAVTPAKAGTYTFLCDLFCGSGHESMSGVIEVKA